MSSTGCCAPQSSKRYECSTCLDSGCCGLYEHCVSCCLHPDKVGVEAVCVCVCACAYVRAYICVYMRVCARVPSFVPLVITHVLIAKFMYQRIQFDIKAAFIISPF